MILAGVSWSFFINALFMIIIWTGTLGADIRWLVASLLFSLPLSIFSGCLAGALTVWIQNKHRVQHERSREIISSILVITFSILGSFGGWFALTEVTRYLFSIESQSVFVSVTLLAWFVGAALIEGLVAIASILLFKLIKHI
jgi:hypothetical protein